MITHIQDLKTRHFGISYGDFVRNLFRPLPPSSMLAHAAMGVVTEIQELKDADSLENAVEECGDIAFFCVAFQQSLPFVRIGLEMHEAQKVAFLAFCRKHSINPEEFGRDDAIVLVDELSIEMLDAAKRWLAYDKAPDNDKCLALAAAAELIAQMILNTVGEGEPDPQAVLDVNVAKLQHRYKGGFSTEAAVNRDVASELKAIQDELAP